MARHGATPINAHKTVASAIVPGLFMASSRPDSDIVRFEPDLFRGQANTDEISAHDDVSSKPAILSCPSVVSFRERAARNPERILLVRADWRDQMGEHQVFCACTLRHCSEVGD